MEFGFINALFLFLLIPVLVSVAMIVWLDRRVWAFVQKRQGPNVVGPFGLLQSLADALKYIFKEGSWQSLTLAHLLGLTKFYIKEKAYINQAKKQIRAYYEK